MREVSSLFAPGGPLSKGLDGYVYRPGQEKMAVLVDQALRNGEFAIIEAGTGIGKTFAYLIPAMEFAGQTKTKLKDHDRRRTVIATGTLQLMTQLYDKDVAILQQRLLYTTRVSLLCGRGNYACIRRFQELYEIRETIPPAQKEQLEKIGEQLRRDDATGLRFRLKGNVPDGLWSMVSCDKDLCVPGTCPYIDTCFFYRAKAEAKRADIVITNHSLLSSDAKVRHDARLHEEDGDDLVLPSFRHLVVDEAHGFEGVASRFYASGYDPGVLEGLLRLLTRDDTKFLGQDAREKISQLREMEITANETLLAVLGSDAGEGEFPVGANSDLPGHVWENLSKVQEMVADLSGQIGQISKTKPESQLASIANHLRTMATGLHLFCQEKGDEETIRSIRVRVGQKNRYAVLEMIPFSVSDSLREDLYDQMDSIVFTSGTLSTGYGGDFSYWMKRMGLWEYERKVLSGGGPVSIPSPFQYQKQMLVMTVGGDSKMPSWKASSRQAFDSVAFPAILSLINAAKGGVLVLLPSYQDLRSLVKEISEQGEKGELVVKGTERTLLFQGQAPREVITKRFGEDTESVLLGTHSFWEGVDVPGRALSMVIIPRIPFRNVNDPFMVKVDEMYQKRSKEVEGDTSLTPRQKQSLLWKESPFNAYQMPYAMTMLRQGMGRLIRSGGDRGVVAILDARLERTGYGKTLQKSFPVKAVALQIDQMAERASEFYKESK